ncbi:MULTISPECIES: hypothetical protein [unclassified Pseudoclavibacter]|uniref:hypothetical protein n=1 Tax=unclassified Pseudoclavibacter TaxID=2615177 RepID=UPI001300F712|nr:MULTISPECIES: hypothetical protein [unclassified Pseudoclavibacter]KAB1647294.1 hypothetical protein F8O06_01610 [Pseudoclavibacter sp. CFCC 14310]KAB1662713.1 hypothetical protein F8O08_09060 [Pseudoclavibacter sp. CFCC 13611]
MTERIRRIGSRRVVYGEVPDEHDVQAERALTRRDQTLAADASAEHGEWGDQTAEAEEDRWLKAQRPPHWG